MGTVDWEIGLESRVHRITQAGKRLPILTEPRLIGFRIPILHEEDFVLSARIAQSGNKVDGMFEGEPIREQLTDQFVHRFGTKNWHENLSEFL